MEVSQSPWSTVKEGTTATFKCSSDEANPPPEIIWTEGNGTDEAKPGRFHALIAESTLNITVHRTMNQKEICCVIEANETTGQTRLEQKVTLSVKCKSCLSLW